MFFDYDRLELYDEIHSTEEDRFNTIGDLNAGGMVIGSAPGQMQKSYLSYISNDRDLWQMEEKPGWVTN